jgi:hypothetical protein
VHQSNFKSKLADMDQKMRRRIKEKYKLTKGIEFDGIKANCLAVGPP